MKTQKICGDTKSPGQKQGKQFLEEQGPNLPKIRLNKVRKIVSMIVDLLDHSL